LHKIPPYKGLLFTSAVSTALASTVHNDLLIQVYHHNRHTRTHTRSRLGFRGIGESHL